MTPKWQSGDGIDAFLQALVAWKGSDIYLTAGAEPRVRIEGVVAPVASWVLTAEHLEALTQAFLTKAQLDEFSATRELNLAVVSAESRRFRVNVHRQRGAIGIVIRRIQTAVPTLAELAVPPVLATIALARRGLVLITGAAGSGKSTLAAAMLDHRNTNAPGHILTVEDPIEFVHDHKRCVVTQREVGTDTASFASALRNSLRQAPDVIFIGEVRDTETMEAAISFSETGHLCVATLHANNANQAVERIINFFPVARHPQILLLLALNLRALLSQRLISGVDGARVAALEIMTDTPLVREHLKRGEIDLLKDAMRQPQEASGGCRTFDEALFDLVEAGRISEEQALANADTRNDLRLRFQSGRFQREPSLTANPAASMPQH